MLACCSSLPSSTFGDPPVILGLGNPLLDFCANVDSQFFSQYKLIEGDAVLYDGSKHGNIYDKLRAMSSTRCLPGGATQNTMRVAQALSAVPGRTAYMGCVGNDADGKIMEKMTQKLGIVVKYERHATAHTGVCACAINVGTKDRSMVTFLGAANEFHLQHLLDNWNLVESAKVIYSAGFFITACPEAMIRVADYCASQIDKFWGTCLCATFLLQPPFLDNMLHCFQKANLVTGNEMEWEAFAKCRGYPEKLDVFEIVDRACSTEPWTGHPDKPRIIIATCGAEPTIVAYKMSQSGSLRVERYMVTPVPKLLTVDTNGCGDAFVGGFLFGWSHNFSLQKCVDIGHACGREVLQNDGVMFSLTPLRDHLARETGPAL